LPYSETLFRPVGIQVMNSRASLALVLPLLVLACQEDKRNRSSTDDTAPTHDTGLAHDPDPDCDTGYLDEDGTCVPAACGTGTWGDLGVDESTIYVNIAAAKGGDGSQSAPLTSIQAGLDAAADADGGMVAVAAGTYPEILELGRGHDGVHLAGRCRELVVIDASAGDESAPGIHVNAKTSEVEVSGVTVSGAGYLGVLVGSGSATLRGSAVVESGYCGVGAYQGGSYATALAVEDCQVRGNATLGVLALDAGTSIAIRDAIIQDTQPDDQGDYGYGIGVYDGASLVAESCVIGDNGAIGVLASDSGTSVSLQDTSIEDTLPREDGEYGYGIYVLGGASLDAEACQVRDNLSAGVFATDSGTSISLRETAIERTQPDETGEGGYGIEVNDGASLDAEACQVRDNTTLGVLAYDSGTSVTLRETSIEDTLPDEDGLFGYGINVQAGASLVAEGCQVRRSSTVGALVLDEGTSVTLRETVIEDSLPDESGMGGYGIFVWRGASLDAEGCQIAGNGSVGLLAFDSGTSVTLQETSIEDTQPDAKGESGYGIEVHSGANLDAQGCQIRGNTGEGVLAFDSGTSVSLRETAIADTQPRENGEGGYGIFLYDGASLEAEDCEVGGNTGLGVLALDSGTSVSLLGTSIEGTHPSETGLFGYGIQVEGGASLDAEGCQVEGNTGLGLVALDSGTSVSLRETSIEGTLPDQNGEVGCGVAVWAGASLDAQGCQVVENSSAGVVAIDSGTSVRLRETIIEDTQPDQNGVHGYGIMVRDGASLDAEGCEVAGNTGAGVVGSGVGTSVTLLDSSFDSTKAGEIQTVGIGVIGEGSASVVATGIEVCSNEGPGLHAVHPDSLLACSGCVIRGNQFAGAVVAFDASLQLAESLIEGTAEQENLGGGVGIYAEPWLGGPAILSVYDTTIQDNAVSGVHLAGQGSYALSGNTIHGGEGWSRESLSKCGDAVYAGDGVTAWDGSWGLLLEGNELLDGLGAGLLLNNASASLSGNSYADNAVDLVSQGADCATPPEGYEEEAIGSAELCPAYDYATCGDEFALYLTLEELESGSGAALMGPPLKMGAPQQRAPHQQAPTITCPPRPAPRASPG